MSGGRLSLCRVPSIWRKTTGRWEETQLKLMYLCQPQIIWVHLHFVGEKTWDSASNTSLELNFRRTWPLAQPKVPLNFSVSWKVVWFGRMGHMSIYIFCYLINALPLKIIFQSLCLKKMGYVFKRSNDIASHPARGDRSILLWNLRLQLVPWEARFVYSSLIIQSKQPDWGWRDTVVRSTCCSSRGSEFQSQLP